MRDAPAAIKAYEALAADTGIGRLMQDLAVVLTMGIPQVERNGHHYFKGLSMLPQDVQDAMLAGHPDVYRRHPEGFVTFRIEQGLELAMGWYRRTVDKV